MNQVFLHILENPLTKEKFQFGERNSVLFSSHSDKCYKVSEGVAVILEKGKGNLITADKLHQSHQTHFDYHDHYEKDAVQYDYFNNQESRASKHESRRLHENIFRRIGKTNSLLLDVGCGKGWVAQKALPMGMQVISMDISTINPQKAIKLYPHPNHLGLVADVFHLPVSDNSLDCIIASEIMEHVADPKTFIRILYNKLKVNGTLIISTPYDEILEYGLCVHCNRPTPRHAHLHSFNEKNIGELIPENSTWSYQRSSNNAMAKLRTDIFLSIFPYSVWRFYDKIANALFSKPLRLIIEIRKK